jgi:hypothetical protein
MSQQPSLADQAVYTLALVARIGEDLTSDAPERHVVRNIKRCAEKAIEAGLQIAGDLAYQAEQISKEFGEEKP